MTACDPKRIFEGHAAGGQFYRVRGGNVANWRPDPKPIPLKPLAVFRGVVHALP
jgi:hypothetical protein